MSTSDSGGEARREEDAASPRAPRLQVEGGRRGAFWHLAFPALLVVLGLSVPAIAWFGREALLDSRGGNVEERVVDPAAPGYEAIVEPTPTMLVVHVSDRDTLEGVTLLARAGPTASSLLFIPVNTSVDVTGLGLPDPATVTQGPDEGPPPGEGPAESEAPPAQDPPPEADPPGELAPEAEPQEPLPDAPPAGEDPASEGEPATDAAQGVPGPEAVGNFPLKDVYQLGGIPALTRATERVLGIGLGGRVIEVDGEILEDTDADLVVEVSDGRWAQLLEPLSPLPVENRDLVVVREGGEVVAQFPSGPIELPAEGVGPYLAARNPAETELNRLRRHEDFWRAWLGAISASEDPGVVPGETDVGLGGFLREVAFTEVAFFALPVDVVAVPEATDDLFVPDEEAIADLIVTLVPFPVGSEEAPRVRVRLLDGMSDQDAALEAADLLVRGGAEIELMGNAASFDHTSNDLVFYDPAFEEEAERFADLLGGGNLALVEEPGEIVQLTVVVGTDFVSRGGDDG